MKARKTGRTERRGVHAVALKLEDIGFAFREQHESDYGVDGQIELITEEIATGQLCAFQIKSGMSYFTEIVGNNVCYRPSKKHYEYWKNHSLPVIVCLYNTESKAAIWELVTEETVISTGKGYLLKIPLNSVIDEAHIKDLESVLTPVVSPELYYVSKDDDTSHGSAKRYSCSIVLNGASTKSEVEAIIRMATNEGIGRRYYRNDLTEARWGDTDAHVVWTYVFNSEMDKQNGNPVCRSCWIDECLEIESRPSWDGDCDIGNGISVKWNDDYKLMGKMSAKHTLTKEAYFKTALPMVQKLEDLTKSLKFAFTSYTKGEITESKFLEFSKLERKQVNELYTELDSIGVSPFECRDMDHKLECVAVSLDNFQIMYSDHGMENRSETNRKVLGTQYLELADEEMVDLKYELKKVR